MRKSLTTVVAGTALLGCGARTILSDSTSAGSSSDASAEASAFDASHEVVNDAKDSSVPDADAAPDVALDAPPDQEPRNCPLVQRQDFLQLGTGEGSASHYLRAFWTGHGFALLWEEGKTAAYYAFVQNGKIEVQPKEVLEPGMGRMPSAAWNGSELVLCWKNDWDTIPDDWDIIITRLDKNGDRVAPDKVIMTNTSFYPSLASVGNRLLLTLLSEHSFEMAWASPQGDLIEGPVKLLDLASLNSLVAFNYADLDNGVLLLDWAFDSPDKIDLNVQRFDSHFEPAGPLQHPVTGISRPRRAYLRRDGAQVALILASDTDQAPAGGWSVWLQSLNHDGASISDIVRIGETSAESTVPVPALAVGLVGDTVLLGAGPFLPEEKQLPGLSLFALDGSLLNNVSWSYPLPTGPSDGLSFAPGSYWGEVAVTFSAYAKQGGHEAFFTVLSCAEAPPLPR